MNKNLKLILSSFTRQESANGCGAACLKMIFNYCGSKTRLSDDVRNSSLSLLQLQQIGQRAGLAARAVKMDMQHLRDAKSPCILHVVTEAQTTHFVTFFLYDERLGLFVIGDPDDQVCLLSESELAERWQSGAGVYFEHLPQRNDWRWRMFPWIHLAHFTFIPGLLWFAVPFLNAFGTMLGLGATLIVEQAASPQFVNGSRGFLGVVFFLLVALFLAKSVVGYFKQQLMIKFAAKLDLELYPEFAAVAPGTVSDRRYMSRHFSDAIKKVQRVHQSVSMLIGGVLCDTVMVVVILACLYYYFPVLVILEILIVALLIVLTDRQLPFMMVSYNSGGSALFPEKRNASADKPAFAQLVNCAVERNTLFSNKASALSASGNKLNFWFDLLSSLNLLLVLAYTLSRLRALTASYQEFVLGLVLCYSAVAMTTKICNQLFLVAQGAQMLGNQKKTC